MRRGTACADPGRGEERGGRTGPGGLPAPRRERGRPLSEPSDWVLVARSSLTHALKRAEPEAREWRRRGAGPCPEGGVCRVCGWTPATERTAAMSPPPPINGDRAPPAGPRPPRVRGLSLEHRSVRAIAWAGRSVTPALSARSRCLWLWAPAGQRGRPALSPARCPGGMCFER